VSLALVDRALFSGLEATDVEAYLRATGWNPTRENEHVSYWEFGQGRARVLVPRAPRLVDYYDVLSDSLAQIARLEDRDLNQVIFDINITWADIIRIHVDPTLERSGTIALRRGVALYDGTLGVASSCARSTHHPQNVYSARPPGVVSDYLDALSLGHTEGGSYVITVLAPIAPNRARGERIGTSVFSRQVTQTLVESLSFLRQTSEAQDFLSAPDVGELIGRGISANLCDSLAMIADASNDLAVQFEISWGPEMDRRSETRNVVLSPEVTTRLPVLSEILRVAQPEPGVELTGSIVRLENYPGASADDFALAMRATIDGRLRTITFDMGGEARDIAAAAWQTGGAVHCRGTLDRTRRPYRLSDIDIFESIEGDATTPQLFD